MPSSDTQFDSESATLAGIKSGISRRPIDYEKDAKNAYKAALSLMDLLSDRIFTSSYCKHCKRGGPIDLKTLDSLSRTLLALIESVQSRAWGKPATESRYGRTASLEDYKRLRREVEKASQVTEDDPNDLILDDDATEGE